MKNNLIINENSMQIYQDNTKLGLACISGFLLILLFSQMIIYADRLGLGFFKFLFFCWVGGILILIGTIYCFHKLLTGNKKPIVIINKNGVFDGSSILSLGFIPWQDIEEVKIDNIYLSLNPFYTLKYKYLIFVIKDPKKLTVLKRLICSLNHYITGKYAIYVSQFLISISEEELLIEIQRHHFSSESVHLKLENVDMKKVYKDMKKNNIVLVVSLFVLFVMIIGGYLLFNEEPAIQKNSVISTPNIIKTNSETTIIPPSIVMCGRINQYENVVQCDLDSSFIINNKKDENIYYFKKAYANNKKLSFVYETLDSSSFYGSQLFVEARFLAKPDLQSSKNKWTSINRTTDAYECEGNSESCKVIALDW